MILIQPSFLDNPEWFYWDQDSCKYILKEGAPKQIVESYTKFYEDIESSKDLEDK